MKDIGIKENILFQLDMCWQLYLYHTENLGEEEAYWTLNPTGLQVRRKDKEWCVDWPESESYEIGPASISWTMWHIIYWWSAAIDGNFGQGALNKDDIPWPGSVEKAKAAIKSLHDKWISILNDLTDEDFQLKDHAKWPFEGRSFADIALWLNAELMKNAAEIGYGRFLYESCRKGAVQP